jgi:hypothetical protein
LSTCAIAVIDKSPKVRSIMNLRVFIACCLR